MADRIVLNTISYHGHGAIENIVPELTARGYKKAFVCSDPDLIKFGVTKKVTDLLDAANFAYAVYSEIKPNPTIANVQDGVAAFKAAEADCIVTIGGGSSMDTAKAIGIIINNPEFADVRSLEGVAPTKKHAVFTIAVPTTAGTAAEVTINYVITDPEAKTALTITPERGGMITSFTLDGEEFVWTRRPNFSECNRPRFGVPVLFPSCGNPDNGVHIFDGKAYPMETHGFADLCAWDVESVGPDGVTLILESTPLTKFLYPFDFTLLLNYNLEGNKALVSLTVINEGNTDMPFSFGYHPYFTASKLENVEFDIKCATCSENAKGEQPAAPEKITLTRKEGADNSVRLLTGVQFPMTLTDKGNGHKVTVDADETFENGVLWQQDAESFVCMEPWNGWANSVNEDGKHEVLEPDEAMTSEWSITIEKV